MHLRLMRARNGLGSASQKEKSWVAKERWAMVRLQEINSVKRYLKVLDHDLHSIRPHWPWFEAENVGSKSFPGCRYWPRNALKIVIYSSSFIYTILYYILYIALSCNSAAETKPGVQPILVKQFINKQCMLRPKPVGLFGGLISPTFSRQKAYPSTKDKLGCSLRWTVQSGVGPQYGDPMRNVNFHLGLSSDEAKVWVHGT